MVDRVIVPYSLYFPLLATAGLNSCTYTCTGVPHGKHTYSIHYARLLLKVTFAVTRHDGDMVGYVLLMV